MLCRNTISQSKFVETGERGERWQEGVKEAVDLSWEEGKRRRGWQFFLLAKCLLGKIKDIVMMTA